MKVYFNIAALFFLVQTINAQKHYRGQLLSGITGRPITLALIDYNGSLVSSTDTLGFFNIMLDNPKNITLSFSTVDLGNFELGGLNFEDSKSTIINFTPDCEFSAAKDIDDKHVKLLCISNAFSSPFSKKDKRFEKKYKLSYHCYTTGIIMDCIKSYNRTISLYLDKKHGKKWRSKIMYGVLGL